MRERVSREAADEDGEGGDGRDGLGRNAVVSCLLGGDEQITPFKVVLDVLQRTSARLEVLNRASPPCFQELSAGCEVGDVRLEEGDEELGRFLALLDLVDFADEVRDGRVKLLRRRGRDVFRLGLGHGVDLRFWLPTSLFDQLNDYPVVFLFFSILRWREGVMGGGDGVG